jgi:hypothetical protein
MDEGAQEGADVNEVWMVRSMETSTELNSYRSKV